MMNKAMLRRKIYELDFAIHELVLFLDTHPTSQKAMDLFEDYKSKRNELISMYENNFGPYVKTACKTPKSDCFKWLEGPWPWENNFMEG